MARKPWAELSYNGKHGRLRQERGAPPQKCEGCGTTEGRISWANISREYLSVDDFDALCYTCHNRRDCFSPESNAKRIKSIWVTRRKNGTDKPGPMSPEARANISAALKGKPKPPRTAEHRANLSAAGKIAMKGRYFSPEHRKRIGEGVRRAAARRRALQQEETI